jgi:hypothetical protein
VATGHQLQRQAFELQHLGADQAEFGCDQAFGGWCAASAARPDPASSGSLSYGHAAEE